MRGLFAPRSSLLPSPPNQGEYLMDPRVAPLAETIRLNTRLFRHCLDGLDEEPARARPSSCTNSAAYVAAHLVESRFFMLTYLGLKQASPLDRYTGGWKSIDEITEWPTLDEVRAAWSAVSDTLNQRLAAATAADLAAPEARGGAGEGLLKDERQ